MLLFILKYLPQIAAGSGILGFLFLIYSKGKTAIKEKILQQNATQHEKAREAQQTIIENSNEIKSEINQKRVAHVNLDDLYTRLLSNSTDNKETK